MDFKNKKVQHAIIGTVVGLAFLFLVIQQVILPAISSWKENSAKAGKVRAKAAEMRAVVQSRAEVHERLDKAKADIKKMQDYIPLPVLGNYLLGLEEYIRALADNLGVTLITIADNDILDISSETSQFKIYRVRVQAKADFNEYVRLASVIHKNNPLCSVSGLNIVAREDNPSKHEINFVVAWLIWSDPANRPAFLIEGKK